MLLFIDTLDYIVKTLIVQSNRVTNHVNCTV